MNILDNFEDPEWLAQFGSRIKYIQEDVKHNYQRRQVYFKNNLVLQVILSPVIDQDRCYVGVKRYDQDTFTLISSVKTKFSLEELTRAILLFSRFPKDFDVKRFDKWREQWIV